MINEFAWINHVNEGVIVAWGCECTRDKNDELHV